MSGARMTQERLAALGIVTLGVLQLLLFLFYFSRSIHPMPRWDFFDWVTGYLETDDVPAWLWARHNEHRLVPNKLLVMLDVAWFGGRLYPVSLVALGGLLGVAALLVREALRSVAPVLEERCWVVGCVLILVFPTFALDGIVYPTNVQFTFVTLFFVLAVSALLRTAPGGVGSRGERTRTAWLLAAIVAALACSLSSANGLFVWPILIWTGMRLGIVWRRIVVIVLSAAALGASEAMDRLSSGVVLAPRALAPGLGRLVEYLVAYFGMPWVAAPGLYPAGMVVGALVVVAATAAVVWKGILARSLEPIEAVGVALLLFAGTTGIATTLSRAELTDLPAHRYTTFAILSQVGLLFAVLPEARRLFRRHPLGRRALLVLPVLAAVVVGQQVVVGRFAVQRAAHFAIIRDAILAGDASPEMIREVYPQPERLRHHLELLESRGLYLFRAR